MPDLYFSEREQGERPRDSEAIDVRVWEGIQGKKDALVRDGSFGASYPETCPDAGSDAVGTDIESFNCAMRAEIPELDDYYNALSARKNSFDYIFDPEPPPTHVVLDMVEFCWRNVGHPIRKGYHNFFKHHHLEFDIEKGQKNFCDWINTIFRRNSLAYELKPNGRVERLVPAVLRKTLRSFSTGDAELDNLLEKAQKKFLDPRVSVRREALQSLWDAWERLKTCCDPSGKKKKGITSLLNVVSGGLPKLRDMLEEESRNLTDIGNSFLIRHSEVSQEKVVDSTHVDYLFYRLFVFIHLFVERKK